MIGFIDQKPRMIEDVYHDLILIENQLPFFVLENMYVPVGRAMSSQGIQLSFAKLTHDFFKHFLKIDEFVEAAAVSTARQNQAKHFLDFIIKMLLLAPVVSKSTGQEQE